MFDLGRSFLAAVERRPNAIAISDGDLKKSYEAWFSDIQRAAHGLERLGLKKGDHLVAVMQNRWQMATLHWACQFSGIIMTPLNWRSSADELAWCTNDAEARVVIHDDSAQEAVAGCGRSTWQCVSVGQPGNDNAISFEDIAEIAMSIIC